jgi:hypothetical protein
MVWQSCIFSFESVLKHHLQISPCHLEGLLVHLEHSLQEALTLFFMPEKFV